MLQFEVLLLLSSLANSLFALFYGLYLNENAGCRTTHDICFGMRKRFARITTAHIPRLWKQRPAIAVDPGLGSISRAYRGIGLPLEHALKACIYNLRCLRVQLKGERKA